MYGFHLACPFFLLPHAEKFWQAPTTRVCDESCCCDAWSSGHIPTILKAIECKKNLLKCLKLTCREIEFYSSLAVDVQ
jgi:hypothetical protein